MKFNYYGHSAFTLSDDVTTILFDPFITENPWTQVSSDRHPLPVHHRHSLPRRPLWRYRSHCQSQ